MPTQFIAALPNNGFDKDAEPRWQMVPHLGYRKVRLTDAAGLTVRSASPGIATVEEHPDSKAAARNREFLIYGKTPGPAPAFIEAIDPKTQTRVARLEVAVKPRKPVTVAFHYVADSAGHKTRRVPGNEEQWVEALNNIYRPQTNIVFALNSVKYITATEDLGDPIVYKRHSPAGTDLDGVDKLKNLGDVTANFRFFFVWELEKDPPIKQLDSAEAVTGEGVCLVEDDLGRRRGVSVLSEPADAAASVWFRLDGEQLVRVVLAHEAGHFLGVPDFYDKAQRHWLMYGANRDRTGVFIPKGHANAMNP